MVSEKGIEIDPRKQKQSRNGLSQKQWQMLEVFLGFMNQYRKFIPKYEHVARSLNELILGDNSKKKKKEVQWTPECQEAFEALKQHCCTTPEVCIDKDAVKVIANAMQIGEFSELNDESLSAHL